MSVVEPPNPIALADAAKAPIGQESRTGLQLCGEILVCVIFPLLFPTFILAIYESGDGHSLIGSLSLAQVSLGMVGMTVATFVRVVSVRSKDLSPLTFFSFMYFAFELVIALTADRSRSINQTIFDIRLAFTMNGGLRTGSGPISLIGRTLNQDIRGISTVGSAFWLWTLCIFFGVCTAVTSVIVILKDR
jgi:hypothetical protein